MKRIFTLALFSLCLALSMRAQSSLFVRNNSWLDFDISVRQKGSFLADPIQYNLPVSNSDKWMEDQEVFIAARDSSVVPALQSVVYGIAISHANDTIWMDYKLIRNAVGTEFTYRLHGNGFDSGYLSDASFHSANVTIDGRALELKFKADNDDSQQNMSIRLALHESVIYTIDSADYANPNVLNVIAYNIQMLPLGVVGLPQAAERGDLLPAQFSPYQDVVIFEEAFDILPRLLNLTPAMEAAGFVHNSGILNNYLPFNGGVIIFSRWPIERTAEYDFQLCGPNAQDCLANKGIKYARIIKLGKPFNVFGTHLDAGSDSLDLQAKNLQYTEMKNFIANQGIPVWEPVIWGGDLNTDAGNSSNLYRNLLDSIDIIVPDYSGFYESNFSRDTGEVIDHVFSDPRFLLPVEAQVYITTFRSLDSQLWDLSNFSDHRAAISRFRFPDISLSGGDQDVCPGATISFAANADIPVSRTWYHDNSQLVGVSSAAINIGPAAAMDAGVYEVEMSYSHTYGSGSGAINALMSPYGPTSYTFDHRFLAGNVTVSPANCPTSASNTELADCQVFPNPANEEIHLRRLGGAPLDWEIRDLRGVTVRQGHWASSDLTIDSRAIPSGVYLLRLAGRSGQVFERSVMLAR